MPMYVNVYVNAYAYLVHVPATPLQHIISGTQGTSGGSSAGPG